MKTKLLLAFAAILIASVFFIDRIPQDPAYHQFADARILMGVDNFWNVVSNLAFGVIGAAGLWYLRVRNRPGLIDEKSRLIGRIEGVMDGEHRSIDFPMTRIACDSPLS